MWLLLVLQAAMEEDEEEDKQGDEENGPAANGEPVVGSELLADDELVLILLRKILLMLDTLGTLYLSQIFSLTRRSLISQANIPGSRAFSSLMNMTTRGVVTLGLLPPIAPGI